MSNANVATDLITLADRLADRDAALQQCFDSLRTGHSLVVMGVNAAVVNLTFQHSNVLADLIQADVLVADGVGGTLFARAVTGRRIHRAPVPDLADVILNQATPPTVYLLGGRPEVADAAATNLRGRGIELAGHQHGFLESSMMLRVMDEIERINPGLVLLAMPSPQKERMGIELRRRTDAVVVGVGGYVDILANAVPRAPKAFRRLGLEWLFRFSMEPRRLAHRYLWGNTIFLARMGRIRLERVIKLSVRVFR